jgi:hypothetical protein
VPRDSSREALRRAHASQTILREDRQNDAVRALVQELADTARSLLAEAVAHRDELLHQALSSSATRPPELIQAEARVAHLTDELAFAQRKLEQSDKELAVVDAQVDNTTTLIREAARAVIADAIASWAQRLAVRMDAIETERAALHGAVLFSQGLGLLLPTIVHDTDLRAAPDFITRNTMGERTARSASVAWREAFESLQVDPGSPLPDYEEK